VDGSTDGTLEMLEDEFPHVHVVLGDGSWWYTKSMNEGFKYALRNSEFDFCLTLNDDIILAHDYILNIEKLVANDWEDTIIGSIGITKDVPTKVVTSGNQYHSKLLGRYKHNIPFLSEINENELSGLHPSITLPGRGMLIPKKILIDLNLFDEKFKQYHSDGDFTLRAIEKGYKVRISWDAKIFISLEKTSASTSFLNKSYRFLIKSFFDPVSRNYLPAKILFIWRHGEKKSFLFRLMLFILVSFRNVK
jgi:GT2 family glycosyltransferase